MTLSEKVQIKSKMQGHDRQAARWEKQARREGKGSEAHRLYTHHIQAWVSLSEILKNS